MNVETKLDINTYHTLVEDMYESYFDEDGIYKPHTARLASMFYFYNYCVSDSGYEIENPKDIMSYEDVFADEEFLAAYTDEIKNSRQANKLTFNQAYRDAKEMAEVRNKNAEAALNRLVIKVQESVEELAGFFTNPENMKAMNDLVDMFSGEQLQADELHELAESIPDDVDPNKLN